MPSYLADSALLTTGWAESVLFYVDDDGVIAGIVAGTEAGADAERLAGPVIPGLANAHCESALRAVAGRSAAFAAHSGAILPWRKSAARMLNALGPDEIEAVHAMAYLEMVKQGFTGVGEVQTLHLTPDGSRYDDRTELSQRIIAAAQQIGVRLTLLPALDRIGEAGIRSALDVDALLSTTAALHKRFADETGLRIGLAVCSLPAVGPDHLAMAVAGCQAQDEMAPIHLTFASDLRDATATTALLETRPVDWLLSDTPIDGRWCLVHASQITPDEAAQIAATDAVIALCPTFEAALGLPALPMNPYIEAGGKLALGTGAPLTLGPADELRALMIRYRLMDPKVGLFEKLVAGGDQAIGNQATGLAAGQPADWVVLDADHPSLIGKNGSRVLQHLPFALGANPVRDVMIGGEWVVRDGSHAEEQAVLDAYREAIGLVLE